MRWLVKRRLADVSLQLTRAREELRVVGEQSGMLTDEAEDARIRSLVSDSPMAAHDYRQAQGPADALGKEQIRLRALVVELARRQDSLLDELSAAGARRRKS